MSVSLINLTKRAYRLYKPYIGFQAKNTFRIFLAAASFAMHVLMACVYSFFNSAMASLVGVLEMPGVTYSAFFGNFFTVFGLVLVNIGLYMVKDQLMNQLRDSIAKESDDLFLKRWIKNKAYYGLKFIIYDEKKGAEKQEISPAQILSHDSAEMLINSMWLLDEFLIKAFQFSAAFIALYSLSPALTVGFWGISLAIPGYFALGSIAYALVFNVISSYMGRNLRQEELRIREHEGVLHHQCHYLEEHGEAIAFLKGADYEEKSIQATLNKKRKAQDNASRIRSAVDLIINLHYEISSFFPLLMSVPGIIAKQLKVSTVYEVLPNFQSCVNLFTFKNERYDTIAQTEVALTRIEKFNNLLTAWEHEKNGMKHIGKRRNSRQEVQLKNVTLLRKNGTEILKNFSMRLEKGKITLISGESGVGKSTLLRYMAELWPYMRKGGELILPDKRKIAFIPQNAFVYHRGSTLLDTIMYPDHKKATPIQIVRIKRIMHEMGLKREIINNLARVKEWDKLLSGGEQQRISIIRAIVKNPSVLLMDESTSAVDHATKRKVERVLKKELPGVTIGYIDHNPSLDGHFHDKVIHLSSSKKRLSAKRS